MDMNEGQVSTIRLQTANGGSVGGCCIVHLAAGMSAISISVFQTGQAGDGPIFGQSAKRPNVRRSGTQPTS